MRPSRFLLLLLSFSAACLGHRDGDDEAIQREIELTEEDPELVFQPLGEPGTDLDLLRGQARFRIETDPDALNGHTAGLYRPGDRSTFDLRGVDGGTYRVVARARSSFFGGWAKLDVRLDGRSIGAPMELSDSDYQAYDYGEIDVSQSEMLELVFINDRWNAETREDRNAWVDQIRLVPTSTTPPDDAPSEMRVSALDDRVTLELEGDADQVDVEDFILLKTHARLDSGRAPVVEGHRVTLFLDDALLPDDEPILDYFGPDGSLTIDGDRAGSFQRPVENDTTGYQGWRSIVRLGAGQSIAPEIRDDTLIVLPRGAHFNESLRIDAHDVVLTAGGVGARPVISADAGQPVLTVEAPGLRVVNLRLEGNRRTCVRAVGTASFLFLSGNEVDNVAPVKDATALQLFSRSSAIPNVFSEGIWALDNDIDGYEDGISSKLEPGSLDPGSPLYLPAEQRKLGGDETPFRVELNRIHGIAIDGPEGDPIQVSRGGYFGTKIRRNTIAGWGDDGIDMFGARDLVVEYNLLDNNNERINNGGNAIKMGGDNGTHNASSGRNIIRYNIVLRTVRERFSGIGNGDGLTTNRGGKAGVSVVYGNLVAAAEGHGFQFTSNGSQWRVFNNTFFSVGSGARGASQYQASGLGELVFRANVVSSLHSSLPQSDNLTVNSLDEIYIDPSDLLNSGLRSDAPSRATTVATDYDADRNGNGRSPAFVGELQE